MIDEAAKRKPCFDELNSVGVVLADGGTWYVAKPWLEIRPVFRDGTAKSAYRALTYGPEFDVLIDMIADAETYVVQVSAVASLAAWLLQTQYELADSELDELLSCRPDDPASIAWVETVIAVATGQSGPKVSRAGDA